MEFVTLTKKEFDDFSNNYKDKCYLQSSNIAEFRKTQGWHTIKKASYQERILYTTWTTVRLYK